MNTWILVAAAVGLCLIVVVLIGTRRPRTIQAELDRPQRPAPARQTPATPELNPSGSLAQTSVRTLLLTMQSSRATGTLTLTRDDEICSLYVLFGHLFHATCGGVEGEQAVQVALSWADGSYAFDPRATLPTAETVTRPTAQVVADADSFATAVSSPRSPESVDWSGLLNRMQQLADAALGNRSGKVKEMLGAAQPSRASFTQAIDRIANTPVTFVDPARVDTLAGQLRRILDEATAFDPRAHLPTTETMTSPTHQDWPALLSQMQQLADAALGNRSGKVKEMLGAAQPSRASFTQAIDRIANTSVMFVDPARLDTLAGQLRRILDEATG